MCFINNIYITCINFYYFPFFYWLCFCVYFQLQLNFADLIKNDEIGEIVLPEGIYDRYKIHVNIFVTLHIIILEYMISISN